MSDEVMDSSLRCLIMTAVEAEREAVLRGLNGDERFTVRLAGVGPASAAALTAAALAGGEYALVVSAGIGGGFPGEAPIGTVALASELVAADLGAETPDGFASVDELGFGSSVLAAEAGLTARLAQALRTSGVQTAVGPIVTVSSATGTRETADARKARTPGVVGEAMEGYGVAVAASYAGVPIIEIRAISNEVGPRDRSAWRIGDALTALSAAAAALREVL